MIIIGEKINSTLKAVRPAIEAYDVETIQDLAKKQFELGASYIDVNAGMFLEEEPKRLEWLVRTVQEAVDAPLSIDSPSPLAIEAALKANRNSKPIINSITAERERFEAILPLILKYDASVIALCMDDTGMPETAEERLTIASEMISRLTKEGMKLADIFIDPMVRPVGTGSQYGVVVLETIRRIREEFPGVHITCGLSNISYGIPARKVMNQTFMIAAMYAGLDSSILDPLDKKLMTFLYAAEALLGKDEFCMNYLMKFREGMLEI